MYLYLLNNKIGNKYYIGITKNLDKRIAEHNKDSKHFTGRQKGHWVIISSKFFADKKLARKEEIRLKRSKNIKYILYYFKAH